MHQQPPPQQQQFTPLQPQSIYVRPQSTSVSNPSANHVAALRDTRRKSNQRPGMPSVSGRASLTSSTDGSYNSNPATNASPAKMTARSQQYHSNPHQQQQYNSNQAQQFYDPSDPQYSQSQDGVQQEYNDLVQMDAQYQQQQYQQQNQFQFQDYSNDPNVLQQQYYDPNAQFNNGQYDSNGNQHYQQQQYQQGGEQASESQSLASGTEQSQSPNTANATSFRAMLGPSPVTSPRSLSSGSNSSQQLRVGQYQSTSQANSPSQYQFQQQQNQPAQSGHQQQQSHLASNPSSQQSQQSQPQLTTTTPHGEDVVVEVQHQQSLRDSVDWKARIANLMRENQEFHEEESTTSEGGASPSTPMRSTSSGSNSMTSSYGNSGSYDSLSSSTNSSAYNSNNPQYSSNSSTGYHSNPSSSSNYANPPLIRQTTPPIGKLAYSPTNATAQSVSPSGVGGVALHSPAKLVATSPTNSSSALVSPNLKTTPVLQTTAPVSRSKASPSMVGSGGNNAIHVHLMSSNPRSMVASPQQIAKLAQEKKDREEKEKDIRTRTEENERNIVQLLEFLREFSSPENHLWRQCVTPEGRYYYAHRERNEVTWIKPRGFHTKMQIANMMASYFSISRNGEASTTCLPSGIPLFTPPPPRDPPPIDRLSSSSDFGTYAY